MDKPLRGASYLIQFFYHPGRELIECWCIVNDISDAYMTLVNARACCELIRDRCGLPEGIDPWKMIRVYFGGSGLVTVSLFEGVNVWDTKNIFWDHAKGWSWSFVFKKEAREAARMFCLCARRTRTWGDVCVRKRIVFWILQTWRDSAWVRVHHKMKLDKERL